MGPTGSHRLALLLALVACKAPTPKAAEPGPAPPTQGRALARYERIQIGGVLKGISGLARRDDGRLLVVPERERTVWFLDLVNRSLDPPAGLPLNGVPEGLDVESAAFREDQLLLGTEAKEERGEDRLLFATVQAEAVKVTDTLALSYSEFGGVAEANHGLEGLCAAAGSALVVSESILEEGEHRYAPLFRVELSPRAVTAHRIRLLSERGKLSGLACRSIPGGLEVVAIERHFATSQLIYFQLPRQGGPAVIEPMLLLDLARLYEGEVPNFEGVELIGPRSLLLVSDNDYGGVKGPTELLSVELAEDPGSGGFRTQGAP